MIDMFILPSASLRFGGRWVKCKKIRDRYLTDVSGVELTFYRNEMINYTAYSDWFKEAEYMVDKATGEKLPVDLSKDLKNYLPVSVCDSCGQVTLNMFSHLCEDCQFGEDGSDA